MTRRSWIWWGLSLAAAAAGLAYDYLQGEGGFAWFSAFAQCPGRELNEQVDLLAYPVYPWLFPLYYGGLPVVVAGLLAVWLSARLGRPRWGRVAARVLAVALLLCFGRQPLGFAVDLVVDRDCLGMWGPGVSFFVLPALAPTLAAVFMLLAVRQARPAWPRRLAVFLTPVVLVAALTSADLARGRKPIRDTECAREAGQAAYLCWARSLDRAAFTRKNDASLLAYGTELCGRYMRDDPDVMGMGYGLSAICPEVQKKIDGAQAAKDREYREWKASEERACGATRPHRPLVKPHSVVRRTMWPDYGIIEAYEGDGEPSDDVLDRAQRNRLAAAVPGHAIILVFADATTCATVETYTRRPPMERKGWDRVVELDYRSPTGHLVFGSLMGGEELPDLAYAGKGRYRIRVHVENALPAGYQRLLIMVFRT
ncbi:DUF3488 domain-containing protein [Nonomuraea sp. NPDC050536]|uniref:DUF3488 domain-containing protein n=1 Tax=Nonomuraea sp. NPDC050536 TaxID=3364366 RepID=UPI0037C85E78